MYPLMNSNSFQTFLNWRPPYQMMSFKFTVSTWTTCKETNLRYRDLLMIKVQEWVINTFLDVNSEEAGVVEEKLLAIRLDIELRPKFRKSYQDFWLQKKVSVVVQYCGNSEDLYHCLPKATFRGKGLQCSRFSFFKAKKQTKYLWTCHVGIYDLFWMSSSLKKLISLQQAQPSRWNCHRSYIAWLDAVCLPCLGHS